MTIAGVGERCKALITAVPRDVFIIAILVLSASVSFGLGYLTGRDQAVGQGSSALTIEIAPAPTAAATAAVGATATPTVSATAGSYVASKNGTKYYLPTCSGAKRISEANQVWFASASAAFAAGYTPAANCKGL